MTQKGQKPSHQESHCVQNLPSGQNRESKAPPLGHKVRKFHRCIYKLSLTLVAFLSQQIKLLFH